MNAHRHKAMNLSEKILNAVKDQQWNLKTKRHCLCCFESQNEQLIEPANKNELLLLSLEGLMKACEGTWDVIKYLTLSFLHFKI